MTDWILIRHGESTANALNQLSGWQDVPLTKKGKTQAVQVGKELAFFDFVHIISSDLQRAFDTATIAMKEWSKVTGKIPPKIQVNANLRERNFFSLQGRDKATLRANGLMAELRRWNSAPLGIETYNELLQRVLPPLHNLSTGKTNALFAHGGVIRALVAHYRDIPRERVGTLKIPNCEPVKITINQK